MNSGDFDSAFSQNNAGPAFNKMDEGGLDSGRETNGFQPMAGGWSGGSPGLGGQNDEDLDEENIERLRNVELQ